MHIIDPVKSTGISCTWKVLDFEDFEECRHTFYKSNELASITHLASPFHCQQQIDEHFFFHDSDKHEASGTYFSFLL
jgi:Kyakuja-Dileera-Zisupton transposase